MTGIDELQWGAQGLLPAIVQDAATRQVLMLAWMNQEALQLTLATGQVHFWSRSRQSLWHKGATSGNVLVVSQVSYDCDGDAILVRAWPQGPACHTGNTSCFYRQLYLAPLDQDSRGAPSATIGPFDWPTEAAEGADLNLARGGGSP
jgi:phosphoribosyl-ATP pyrophosphohydrolase/phosphoribosyl-AMP cyclohydrolase